MASVNWNEYNDSSSISSMSSGLEDVLGKQEEKEIKSPTLNKIVSSPDPTSKLNSQRQIKIDENLEKIKNHKGDKVLLYVPENQRVKDKVNQQILSKEEGIERVTYSNKGWQILTSIQRAEKLIQKGLFINGVRLNFLYSMKNKPREFTSPNSKGKGTFKAKQFSSPNYRKEVKSPGFKQRNQEGERKYQRKETGKSEPEKKKVKYVAKTIDEKIEQTHLEESEKEKQKQIEVEEKELKKQKEKEKDEKIEQTGKKEDNDDSSNSSEELKKMKKELQKKKGKKRGKGKGGYQDNNNPFASFAGND